MAEDLGLVGYSGRASGIDYDARVSFPTEAYGPLPANRNEMTNGDVYSRATVRREEIMHSMHLIRTLLTRIGRGQFEDDNAGDVARTGFFCGDRQ